MELRREKIREFHVWFILVWRKALIEIKSGNLRKVS